MRFFQKTSIFILLLAVSTVLCACGSERESAAEETPELPFFDIAGDETPAPPPPADSVLGSYYNDYLRLTLQLDGHGNAELLGADYHAGGTYVFSGENLTLTFPDRTEYALLDADGDITIDGMTGRFLSNWEFWGITESEAGIQLAPSEEIDYQNIHLGDGKLRYRDFDNKIAFTYAEGISVYTGELIGAVAATDGDGGYVSGRNVTDNYRTSAGTDDEFLEDYIKTFVFADFAAFYQSVSSFDDIQFLQEDIDGRIAAATLNISGADQTIAVKVILYTSTYADGTVNYICKTIFAPAEDTARLASLAEAVSDMSAVRMVEK